MQSLDHMQTKQSFATHAVPLGEMAGTWPFEHPPKVGDLVLAEVLSLGQHTRIEDRAGATVHIFPGDQLVGVFGNRYATDQFEGYVPQQPVDEGHLFSVGGVCGLVASRHSAMNEPTRVRFLGAVCDGHGRPLSLCNFRLSPRIDTGSGAIIAVVGAAMNAGKTTTAGTLARALRQAGFGVAAAKLTGTAASKDTRFIASCGAKPTLDFTDAGYPSTYMLSLDELLDIYRSLVTHLRTSDPDYIILELADGIFQRETRMLLEDKNFRSSVQHVFFSANDSLSAECGVRWLRERALPLRAVAGVVSQSVLGIRETEAATGVACLSIDHMLDGTVVRLLGAECEVPMPMERVA